MMFCTSRSDAREAEVIEGSSASTATEGTGLSQSAFGCSCAAATGNDELFSTDGSFPSGATSSFVDMAVPGSLQASKPCSEECCDSLAPCGCSNCDEAASDFAVALEAMGPKLDAPGAAKREVPASDAEASNAAA
jgi:hypothetical protein